MSSIDKQKASLRAEMKAKRDKLAREPDRADRTRSNLTALISKRGPETISGYLAIGSELDPMPALAQTGRSLCVPVVAGSGQPLKFCAYAPGDALEEGAFGVRIPSVQRFVVPDFVVVPLLAFDRHGYRLGYGGGFYDRTLAVLREGGPTFAVGLAFAGQECDQVPIDRFDSRLDAVVTEDGILQLTEWK